MKRAIVLGPFLLAILLVILSCTLPANPDLIQQYIAGTQTAEAANLSTSPQYTQAENQMAAETTPSPLAAVSRCDLYSESDLRVILLGVYPESRSLTTYIEFPEAVIGLEDDTEDGYPWEYSANLGDFPSIWCALLEGEDYAGRLYCMLPLPKEYHNSVKPFSLFVNNCDTPIVSIPSLSIVVEEGPSPIGSGSTGGPDPEPTSEEGIQGIFEQFTTLCGAEPAAGFNCTYEYSEWCACMGGSYECSGEGMGFELNMCHFP
jgi:hypothetical protein